MSERVVSYMSAIDVRAPNSQTPGVPEGVTYAGGEQPGRPAPRNPAENSWEDRAAQPLEGDSGSEAYASHESVYGNDDLYPYWGYTYPGPYYVYPAVAVDQGNPFQPAHAGRGDHPAHHGQPGHHRSDGWRDRGAHGRSHGNTVAATRRSSNAGPSRGFRASSPSRSMTAARTPPAMRGPRTGSMNGSRSFGSSAGPRTGAGGTSLRAPVLAHGGGVARGGAGMSAPAGGRGRR